MDGVLDWLEQGWGFEALLFAGGVAALVALRRSSRRARPQQFD